jgi:hypothetical protein
VRDDRDQSEPIPAGEKGREQQHDERESNKPGNHELCVYRQRILSSSWFFYIKKTFAWRAFINGWQRRRASTYSRMGVTRD